MRKGVSHLITSWHLSNLVFLYYGIVLSIIASIWWCQLLTQIVTAYCRILSGCWISLFVIAKVVPEWSVLDVVHSTLLALFGIPTCCVLKVADYICDKAINQFGNYLVRSVPNHEHSADSVFLLFFALTVPTYYYLGSLVWQRLWISAHIWMLAFVLAWVTGSGKRRSIVMQRFRLALISFVLALLVAVSMILIKVLNDCYRFYVLRTYFVAEEVESGTRSIIGAEHSCFQRLGDDEDGVSLRSGKPQTAFSTTLPFIIVSRCGPKLATSLLCNRQYCGKCRPHRLTKAHDSNALDAFWRSMRDGQWIANFATFIMKTGFTAASYVACFP
eukprot:Gregarina_sp_Poly_1__2604@NODE_1707_length_3505_cov_893_625073_g1118_i0_p2_GENE_NODE_1707_length_3505_cov_893_625073_g1118_i0NODE_1707_length_3505_cov_893_625073_g1118_i0_p2_ORF_typecomplete_len330_score7_98Wzy_C_2/PF11846_8/1_5e04Wzy_C_2/PF11846_8/0_012_NODE_1707_length_3505_cov_893_625073_g1118_i06851674